MRSSKLAPPAAWLDAQIERTGAGWILAAVLTLAALTYLPTLRFPFVYDDGWVLLTNGFLREPDLAKLFSPVGAQEHIPDVFRPTSVLFDLLTYRAFGLDPRAHHALSLLLHLGVSGLAFAFARRVGTPTASALAGTAVFATMAIHAEAVSVISYREDMLALALGLGASLAASDALRRRGREGAAAMLAAGLLMGLAAGAKLSVAPLPLVWWMLESHPPHRRQPAGDGRLRALIFVVLALGVGAALLQRTAVSGGVNPYLGDTPNPRVLATREGISYAGILAASAEIHLRYLLQFVIPIGLSPEYADFHLEARSLRALLASSAILGALATGVAAALRGRRGLAFVIAAFALLALPTANLIGMPNMRADRFTYASSLPIAFGLGAWMLHLGLQLAARSRSEALVLAPVVALILLQGSFTIAASTRYVSNRSLWTSAVKRAPTSARAHAMMGLMRLSVAGRRLHDDAGLPARIEADCRRGEALDPLDELPQICFARLYAAQGAWKHARARFLRAVELAPDHEGAWLAALAQAELEALDEPVDAASQRAAERRSQHWLERAISEYPYLPEVHLVAARLAQRRGDAKLARVALGRARSLRPERWETVLALMELQLDMGHVSGAYAIWRQEATVLAGADPIAREHMMRRLRDAQRLGLTPDP